MFQPKPIKIDWTYPDEDMVREPTEGERELLDRAVADLEAVVGRGSEAERRARRALAHAIECADLHSWAGWRAVLVTKEARVRPGREREAREWLRAQGSEELLTKVKLARFLDRSGLFAPDELFLVNQIEDVRRVRRA